MARENNQHIDNARKIDCRNYLTPSRGGMYCCPFCGSGDGVNRTGAVKLYEESNTCFCFACRKRFDSIDLHREKYGVDFQTAVGDMTGDSKIRSTPKTKYPAAKKKKKEKENPMPIDFLDYFLECAEHLKDERAAYYLKGRGISADTARNLCVGFDAEADPANYPGRVSGELRFPCPRIIFPCGEDSYQGRAIIETEYPKIGNPGTLGLFNYDVAMVSEQNNIFIVEGGFDALSVHEVGGVAIAINGVGNVKKLVSMLKSDDRTAEKKFILCLDNDRAGSGGNGTLYRAMQEAYIPCLSGDISCGEKDPNSALTADRAAFSDAVAWAKEQEPVQEEPEREFTKPEGDYSDAGNAEAFIPYINSRLIFTHEYGWLSWDGARWIPDKDTALNLANDWTSAMWCDAKNQYSDILRRMTEAKEAGGNDAITDEMMIEGADAKAYYAHGKKSRSRNAIRAIIDLAAARCSVKADALDADPYILNTPGGMYDLRTGRKILFDSSKLCTKITTTAPGSEGAEMWQSFLETVTDGNGEMQNYLQYLCGAVALGEVTDQVIGIFFCYSEHGSTGKSTFWNTIAAVIGDYAISLPVSLFTTASLYQDPKFKLPRLKGARLILLSELPERSVLSNGNLKALASVDPITGAENKGKPPFDFNPSGTYIGYSNHLPQVNETDSGTWRRLHILPFNHLFLDGDADPNFPERLKAEAAPAILRWIIDGAAMFVKDGKRLPKCRSVDDAGRNYKTREDQIGRFIGETLEPAVTTGEKVHTGRMYRRYSLWCGSAGEKNILSQRQFTSSMKSRGYGTNRDNKGDFFNQFFLKDVDFIP